MATAAGDSVDVILRDGGTLRLRPPTTADSEPLLDFYRALSSQSLHRRFHGFPNLRPQLVESLLDPDWAERGALLGALADENGERIVAIGNYVRLRDPTLAESAFAVADSEQGRGIGTRLLERLADRAAGVGIERFVAEVLPENRSMLGVFERAGFELKRELAGGVVEVQFPIASTVRFERSVEERDHTAVVASLRSFFEPRSVAIVGASPRRGTIGGELFRNVLEGDFTGTAFPVNPKGVAVAGVRGYASVATIPDPVDLAVIAVPSEYVLDAAEDALRHGVRALVVISAGFAEVGSDGAERQEQLLALVRSHGARLIGPNCLGIAVAGPRLNATFAARSAPSGNIGFSSQSGALGLALLEAADARGLGLSAFISIGNKADVSSNDLLEWWEEDEATEVVLLYVESFGNPRRFGRLARRVARRKPILALKSGTSATGQRAASSHTAALAGSEAGVDALFHQAGVTRATSLEELIDVATLLSSQPEPKGRRVAVLTNAGGLGILAADACDAAGLELPALGEETVGLLREQLPAEASVANPVDMLGSATAASYEAALPVILRDAQVDAVLVLFVPAVSATADEVAVAVDAAARAVASEKPVLAVVMSSAGIPQALRSGAAAAAFAYPESAARALGRVAGRAEWLRRPLGSVPSVEGIDRAAAASVVESALGREEDSWRDPAETRELLAAYGLPLVPERIAEDVDAAVRAAVELGFPVVVKSAAAGAHKTETGGIVLDLEDEAAVRVAAERIGSPVDLQPMLRGGTELLAGLLQDPVFGPLVAFGPGGVFAELIGEATLRIAPLTDIDAEELVTTGKAGRLVRGFRGAPPADPASLVDLVHRLAALGEDLPAV
ncbi:MAG TPA: GNAT family N-acetyltransferase, partial [Gaiellaceae bacterium]|nr:GNAT family N-acetyltransferase [Gaiellaceae bacterium]